MAILKRQVNGRRSWPGLTYLHRPTKGKKELNYAGREYRKVYQSYDTDEAYERGLQEKWKEDRGVVWTGERVGNRRIYGVFVRKHKRRVR